MITEELKQIKNERDEMEKHMTDMFDLAFMINNHDDLAKSQEHHEKLSRMVTHYMGSIQQSYGYMSEKAIKSLEQGNVLDKIRAEIKQLHHHPILDFINNDKVVDMAIDIIDKYKAESEGNNADSN